MSKNSTFTIKLRILSYSEEKEPNSVICQSPRYSLSLEKNQG